MPRRAPPPPPSPDKRDTLATFSRVPRMPGIRNGLVGYLEVIRTRCVPYLPANCVHGRTPAVHTRLMHPADRISGVARTATRSVGALSVLGVFPPPLSSLLPRHTYRRTFTKLHSNETSHESTARLVYVIRDAHRNLCTRTRGFMRPRQIYAAAVGFTAPKPPAEILLL